jgi:hypothetical protein
MASIAYTNPTDGEDEDCLAGWHSWLNLDQIQSSLAVPSSPNNFATQDQLVMTMAMDNPSSFSFYGDAVAVTPSSSCNGLSDCIDIEPRTLQEMAAAPISAYVSPTPSTTASPIRVCVSPIPAASNEKKRSYSSSSNASSPEAVDRGAREDRRKRNREHAKKSRERKKLHANTLQDSLNELKEENRKLRLQLTTRLGPTRTEAMFQARLASSPTTTSSETSSPFVAALQNQQSRVIDAETLTFLKKLRTNVPAMLHHHELVDVETQEFLQGLQKENNDPFEEEELLVDSLYIVG